MRKKPGDTADLHGVYDKSQKCLTKETKSACKMNEIFFASN